MKIYAMTMAQPAASDPSVMTEALTDGHGSIFVAIPTTCMAYTTAQVMVTQSHGSARGSAGDLQKPGALRSCLISPPAFI